MHKPNLRSLLIAVPAFLLGVVTTATLTTTAQAQAKTTSSKPEPRYRIVTNEATMNKYAAQGYEVQSVSSTANYTNYLMKRW